MDHNVTSAAFTVYTSPTGTLNAGALGPPAGVSKACLSCHDGTIQNDLLFVDQMECGSCHDVHNTAAIDPLLRKSNAASALCLTCHDK